MKNIFFLLLSLAVNKIAYSHSQYPSTLDVKTLNEIVSINLTVSNISENKKKFQMFVNDDKYGRSYILGPQNNKEIKFRLVTVPDEVSIYNICSYSEGTKNDAFNTQVCSTIYIDYPLSRLIKLTEKNNEN